jgi:hypothetical protein
MWHHPDNGNGCTTLFAMATQCVCCTHAPTPSCCLPPPSCVGSSPQDASGTTARGAQLPLAIMTSDDTHARTQALLQSHSYFGMAPEQVSGSLRVEALLATLPVLLCCCLCVCKTKRACVSAKPNNTAFVLLLVCPHNQTTSSWQASQLVPV